jgi:integrase
MHHLGREELLALLKAARAARERDWVMFLVAFWHGLRASEVVGKTGLTAGSFYERDGELWIRAERGKGSMPAEHVVFEHPEPMLDELAALRAFLPKAAKGPLFPISRRQFHRLMVRHGRAAGIPRHLCHPHVLKHSIAMFMLHELDLKVDEVQAHLGHLSMSSTGAYLKLRGDEASRRLREALRRGPAQRRLFG